MSTTFPPHAAFAAASTLLSRRSFLRGAAAGAALLCAAPAYASASVCEQELAADTGLVREARLLMGTIVHITAAQTNDARATEALSRAFERMAALEKILSRHDTASPLAELNRTGRLTNAPQELCALAGRAQRFHGLTGGAFDPTVTPVLELFAAHKNPDGTLLVDPYALRQALELVQAKALHVDKRTLSMGRTGMALTLDGIAKGYIVDETSRVLHQYGVHHHIINAGGDIIASGEKAPQNPWTAGIEHPLRQSKVGGEIWQTLPLRGALATSGSAHMYFDAARTHHHLINPLSGSSPTQVCSVSVTAPTVLQADALATALSIMVPGDALRLTAELPGVECCILRTDGQVMTSARWGA